MAAETDHHTPDLCKALCARAGMLFEDASVKLILSAELQDDELRFAIQAARVMARHADALLTAAEVLVLESKTAG